MKANEEKINEWVSNLTEEQLREITPKLIECAMDSEFINFWQSEDNIAPYWEGSGEPLVEGQQCYEDDIDYRQ